MAFGRKWIKRIKHQLEIFSEIYSFEELSIASTEDSSLHFTVFPSGHLYMYWSRSTLLNFSDRTGTGVQTWCSGKPIFGRYWWKFSFHGFTFCNYNIFDRNWIASSFTSPYILGKRTYLFFYWKRILCYRRNCKSLKSFSSDVFTLITHQRNVSWQNLKQHTEWEIIMP